MRVHPQSVTQVCASQSVTFTRASQLDTQARAWQLVTLAACIAVSHTRRVHRSQSRMRASQLVTHACASASDARACVAVRHTLCVHRISHACVCNELRVARGVLCPEGHRALCAVRAEDLWMCVGLGSHALDQWSEHCLSAVVRSQSDPFMGQDRDLRSRVPHTWPYVLPPLLTLCRSRSSYPR